jgi:hypothetical protein
VTTRAPVCNSEALGHAVILYIFIIIFIPSLLLSLLKEPAMNVRWKLGMKMMMKMKRMVRGDACGDSKVVPTARQPRG